MDAQRQIQGLVEAAQPHCDELIEAAMTCSHAGSMTSALLSKVAGGMLGVSRMSGLPNPVFIAVGHSKDYAFDDMPRGLEFKIEKEATRWPRADLTVAGDETDRMAFFTMTTGFGDLYAMEIPTVIGQGRGRSGPRRARPGLIHSAGRPAAERPCCDLRPSAGASSGKDCRCSR